MAGMFTDARAFNQPLTSWNTSLVSRMDSMFFKAFAFNQTLVRVEQYGAVASHECSVLTVCPWFPLSLNQAHLSTSRVTNMAAMFTDARVFNQPLTGWDTSLVNRMDSMFLRAYAFNQPIVSVRIAGRSRL
jgi:Mycoplasma protein of unknown function, DUF285